MSPALAERVGLRRVAGIQNAPQSQPDASNSPLSESGGHFKKIKNACFPPDSAKNQEKNALTIRILGCRGFWLKTTWKFMMKINLILGIPLFGLGLVLFASCGSKEVEKTTIITNYVTNYATIYITNTVILTNEIIKEVPARIPDEYFNDKVFVDRMQKATVVYKDLALFQMKDVKARYIIADEVNKIVAEDSIKARFELTLRRNGVSINPDSENTVCFTIDAMITDDGSTVVYDVGCFVAENQLVMRNDEMHVQKLIVWNALDNFGRVGKLKAEEALLNLAEKDSEIFANDFLSANPKK